MKLCIERRSGITVSCLMLLAAVLSGGCSESRAPTARNGILDLRSWDFVADGEIDLSGAWAFYWQTYLPPDQPPETYPAPSSFITVPGNWKGTVIDGQGIPAKGYATYHITVLLPKAITEEFKLALIIRNIRTSFELFVNGGRTAGSGTLGTDIESTEPARFPQVTVLPLSSDRVDIMVHVANFHHLEGGIWDGIVLGMENEIRRIQIGSHSRELFILGSIVVMGISQLVIWSFRRKDRTILTFGLFCLLMAVWALTTDTKHGLNLLPGAPWTLVQCARHIAFFLLIPTFMFYIRSMFPTEFSRRVLQVSIALGALFSVSVLVLPSHFYAFSNRIYYFIAILSGLYIFYVVIQALRRGLDSSQAVALGYAFFFAVLMNDMLYILRIISSRYVTLSGMLVFILIQAWLLARRAHRLFVAIEQKSDEVIQSRLGTILGLAKLAEYRDEDTGFHLERISQYCCLLGSALIEHPKYHNYVDQAFVEDLHHSSILHDIGKVWVKDSVLLKPGRLTEEEFAHIRRHPAKGGDIIRTIEGRIGTPSYLRLGREIAYSHHEKWDGSGYPDGLRGEQIPLSARIVAVADVYDALTSKRPYKPAFDHDEAVAIIREGRGSHFDPNLVDVFLKLSHRFDTVRRGLTDQTAFGDTCADNDSALV